MPVTQSYPRFKSVVTNATGIALTLKAGEGPITPHVLNDNMGMPDAGTTGILTAILQADADESGSTDIKDLFHAVLTPSLNSAGVMVWTIAVTAYHGDGTPGNTSTLVVTHDDNMDAWQTAAGRNRQP